MEVAGSGCVDPPGFGGPMQLRTSASPKCKKVDRGQAKDRRPENGVEIGIQISQHMFIAHSFLNGLPILIAFPPLPLLILPRTLSLVHQAAKGERHRVYHA